MLLQIHFFKIKQFVIYFFILNIGMQDKIKNSSRKFKYFDFIKDLFNAKVTDKRSELLKVNGIEQDVDEFGQHVRLMSQDNEHILIKWILEFWLGVSQMTPS